MRYFRGFSSQRLRITSVALVLFLGLESIQQKVDEDGHVLDEGVGRVHVKLSYATLPLDNILLMVIIASSTKRR